MDRDLRIFISCIYGEAANCSAASWKAIASCILNRIGRREWKRFTTTTEIIAMTGFDAFEHENVPFRQAMTLLASHPQGVGAVSRLLDAVLPLYERREPTIPGLVLYYSPKAQAALHKKNPEVWRAPRPAWNFTLLEQLQVPGTEADDFAWFKYKETPHA